MTSDEPTKKELIIELMAKSSNCCCVCQMPFIQIHHIDFDKTNNSFDNLAPLCLNHHALAQATSNMFLNLSAERIKAIRDKWYEYCDKRKQNLGDLKFDGSRMSIGKLKLKNFDRILGGISATCGWKKTFASMHEDYKDLTKDEIIDRVFSTTNPDELKTLLETVKYMYSNALRDESVRESFRDVCNAFGFDFNGEKVI